MDAPRYKKSTLLATLGLLSLLVLLGGNLRSISVGEELRNPAVTLPVSTVDNKRPHRKRFSLRQSEDGWTLVSPEGKPFFSRGVCVFDQGTPRASYSNEKPSYAAWRHYDSPGLWADANLVRLKNWGFTTVGGWSDDDTVMRSKECSLWLTPVVHIGSTVGLPWFDMWDESIIESAKQQADDVITPLRDDPRVIGYYSDNEIGWWNAALWRMTFDQDAASGQRRRLVALVRDHYADDFSAVLQDFDAEGATNWEQLERGGRLKYKPGGKGMPVLRRFLSVMAERYYQLMSRIINDLDPGALYLGDRYQSFYYPEVARASAEYVDVVSTNLNAHWNDGTFLRCYLDTLHEITQKPILVSEFYMASMENGSNNPNSSSQFPTVATQVNRAVSTANSLDAFDRLKYVVGADWFQYYDEPPHGRYDGENYNFGLVDIENRVYEELTSVFAGKKFAREDGARKRPDASSGVPRLSGDPFAQLLPGEALRHWDREHGFVKPSSELPLADLYICWSPQAVYLGLFAMDVMESELYGHSGVAEADLPEWTVQVGDLPNYIARIGGGHEPQLNDEAIRIESLTGVNHNNRLIAIMEITAAKFGKLNFNAGDTVQLNSSLETAGRNPRVQWQGTFTLSK